MPVLSCVVRPLPLLFTAGSSWTFSAGTSMKPGKGGNGPMSPRGQVQLEIERYEIASDQGSDAGSTKTSAWWSEYGSAGDSISAAESAGFASANGRRGGSTGRSWTRYPSKIMRALAGSRSGQGSNAAEQAGAAGATRTEEDTYLDTMTAKLDSKSMTEATFYMGPIQVTLSLVTDDEEAPAGGGKQRSVPPAKRSLSRASTVASLSSVKTAQEDTRPEAAGAAADESATSTDAWNCETHSTQNTAHVSVLDAADYQKPSESLGTTTASSSYWSSSDGVLVSEVGYSFLAIDGNNIPQFECVSGAWDGGKGELATSCYGLRMVARMAQYAAAAIGIGFSLTVDEDKLQFNVSGVNWANIDSYLKLARRFITIDGDEPLEVFLKYGYPSKKQKGKRIERTVRVAMLIGSVGK